MYTIENYQKEDRAGSCRGRWTGTGVQDFCDVYSQITRPQLVKMWYIDSEKAHSETSQAKQKTGMLISKIDKDCRCLELQPRQELAICANIWRLTIRQNSLASST